MVDIGAGPSAQGCQSWAGRAHQSAVMPSDDVTARSATTCECVRWSPCSKHQAVNVRSAEPGAQSWCSVNAACGRGNLGQAGSGAARTIITTCYARCSGLFRWRLWLGQIGPLPSIYIKMSNVIHLHSHGAHVQEDCKCLPDLVVQPALADEVDVDLVNLQGSCSTLLVSRQLPMTIASPDSSAAQQLGASVSGANAAQKNV